MPPAPSLLPGDIFCVSGEHFVAKVIMVAEKIWSKDDHAEFGHCGVVTMSNGTTLEALVRIKNGNIRKYKGQKVLVARPTTNLQGEAITLETKWETIRQFENLYLGDFYPVWRLLFHLLGPIVAKYLSTGDFMVCSELVARYEEAIGSFRGTWKGQNPDDVADRIRMSKRYEVLYDDDWPS